ncbi:hypothetical protein JZU68_02225, partial [bacterium]|nr:hypothetical protein [bacterium]
ATDCERFLTKSMVYKITNVRISPTHGQMVELMTDKGIITEFYEWRFQLVDHKPQMMKLVLHAALTRTGPDDFEIHLAKVVDSFSRVQQVGYWRTLKHTSYQYTIFLPTINCVGVQEAISLWFETKTNEECILFEVQTDTTWSLDTISFDRASWRDAVDRILANPGNLQDKPVADLQSRYGFKGGSF